MFLLAPSPLSRTILLILSGYGALAAFARAESVILWANEAPRPGLSLTEDMTLQLDAGSFSLLIGEKTLAGHAAANLHDTLDRTWQSPDEQTVQMHVSTRNIVLGFGKLNMPKAQQGQLAGKKLLGHKSGNEWVFELPGISKPEGAQKKALKQFTGFVEVMEALKSLYDTTPHNVGDTWKPDLAALKKTPAKLDADLQCKLENVTEREGVKLAQVSVHGHMGGTVGETAKVTLDITGTILRDLRDQVDLDMDLTGAFEFTGSIGKDSAAGPSAQIKAPLRVKRVVTVQKP